MKNSVVLTFLTFASILLTSCGNKIIYYGRTYAPVPKTDLYFREVDVKEDFEVMGKLTYEVSAKRKSEKVQARLLKRASENGADVILFDEISLSTTGNTTGGAAAGVGKRRGFLGIFGSKSKYTRGQLIRATLLKYKRNL
jgi:hypothetical protein